MLDRDGCGESVIDISQWWVNSSSILLHPPYNGNIRGSRVALDAMGIAGFGHDFQALDGKTSVVMDLFDSFVMTAKGSSFNLLFFLSFIFPVLDNIPNPRNKLVASFGKAFRAIADDLLKKCRSQEEFGGEKSMMGTLSECFGFIPVRAGTMMFSSQGRGQCIVDGGSLCSGVPRPYSLWTPFY